MAFALIEATSGLADYPMKNKPIAFLSALVELPDFWVIEAFLLGLVTQLVPYLLQFWTSL